MRLELIDDEHGRAGDGALYVLVGGRWRPGGAALFDRHVREYGHDEHDAPQSLADFLSVSAARRRPQTS